MHLFIWIFHLWYLKTSAWLNIQYLSSHLDILIAINIAWCLMFPFVMHFRSFFLENSKPFIYLRELIFYISDLLFASFVPVTFHQKSAIQLLLILYLTKAYGFTPETSLPLPQNKDYIEPNYMKLLFLESKYQMSAISYGLS